MTYKEGQGLICLHADSNPWIAIKDGDARARGMLNRHYSARHYQDGRSVKKSVGPGEYLLLMLADSSAVFAWVRNTVDRLDGQEGLYCSLFRRESGANILASELIRHAEELAIRRWPTVRRFFTYIDPREIESTNPGYCFLMAGWERDGWSEGGKLRLAKSRAKEEVPA